MSELKLRPVKPNEHEVAGELVVEAYRSLGDEGDEFYERELRNVSGRIRTTAVMSPRSTAASLAASHSRSERPR